MSIAEKYGLRPASVYVSKLPEVETLRKIESTALIGIEVEVENSDFNGDHLDRAWSVKEDGSLRNNGSEFITKPIPASTAPKLLHNLLNKCLAKTCCFSPRTSVHVHLNCQSLEMSDVTNILLTYCVFEKLFYRFAGRGRAKNIYCVPITETNYLTYLASTGITEQWLKYTGLNAKPIFSFGTLEFRHMHGTFNVEKLSEWINIITSLQTYVLKNRDTIRETLSGLNSNSDIHALITAIFGDSAMYLGYKGYSDVENEIELVKTAFCINSYAQSLGGNVSSNSPFYLRYLKGKK